MMDDFNFFPYHDAGGKVRLELPDDVVSEAIYSPCQQYRYLLHRQWAPEQPRRSIMFLMLNPSTATEDVDDPTVRKCRNYAIRWGYNILLIGNIMAYRATDPSTLRGIQDPVGPDNLLHLTQALQLNPMLICAWGQVNRRYAYAEQAVIRLIRELRIVAHALRVTVTGSPNHPLYLSMDTRPVLWKLS